MSAEDTDEEGGRCRTFRLPVKWFYAFVAGIVVFVVVGVVVGEVIGPRASKEEGPMMPVPAFLSTPIPTATSNLFPSSSPASLSTSNYVYITQELSSC